MIMDFNYCRLTNTKELRKLCEYATEKEKKMQNLYKDSIEMGFWSRVLVSKVSERDQILEKIRDYEQFYEELIAFALKITDLETVNCDNLLTEISRLKNRLSQVYELAKREERETSTKAICNMHQSFIREYWELTYIVKDFENAVLYEMFTTARNGWRRAVDELAPLKEQLSNINHKFDALERENYKRAAENEHIERKMEEIIEILRRFFP